MFLREFIKNFIIGLSYCAFFMVGGFVSLYVMAISAIHEYPATGVIGGIIIIVAVAALFITFLEEDYQDILEEYLNNKLGIE